MVIVEIKLLSGIDGHEEKLGRIEISNDLTGDADNGNYNVKIGTNGNAKVKGYKRKKASVYMLLYMALTNYYGKRL